jgi:hypothetical protein
MSEENSNPKKEADEIFDDNKPKGKSNDDPNKDKSPKPNEGDGSKDKKAEDEAFLARINQEEGKNFKSIEDWKESRKNLEKAATDKGRENKPDNSLRIQQEVITAKNPDLEYSMEEAKEIAEVQNKDLFTVFEKYPFLTKQAEAKAEAKRNAENVSDPSGEVEKKETELEKMEKKFDSDYPPGFDPNN